MFDKIIKSHRTYVITFKYSATRSSCCYYCHYRARRPQHRVMAIANYSGDFTQKTFKQQLCRAGLTAAAEIHSQLTFLSALNVFLSITAVLGHALIPVALRKECCLHLRSKILLRSLAVSDLCVGLISEPLTVTYWMSELNGRWNISVSLRMGRGLYSKYYFVCGVFVESDCDRRRKTSRPVGTEVQAWGNFQRNLCYRHNILGCIHCNNHNVFLEFSYSLVACLCSGISLSCDLSVFLHKDLLFPPPLSSPATKPDATNLPRKPTEHITIQKGSVHCSLVATDTGRLLSSSWYSDSFVDE